MATRTQATPPLSTGTFISMPTISAAPRGTTKRSGGFWRDAFRPFYLGGSIFAALSVFMWLSTWYHGYAPPASTIAPLFWHVHEMVYGFAAAIIIGFLFTAARNWTGLPLPAGAPLAIIFGLWAAARLGMYFAYGVTTAIIDSLLLLIVAAVLARSFIRARSYSAFPLTAVLILLAATNITFHVAMLTSAKIAPMTPLHAGLFLVIMMELIIGSRIVPGFTTSALPGVRILRSKPLNYATQALAALAFITHIAAAPAPITGTLALLAGVAALVQLLGWNPLATRKRPILWILHVSYAWIPVGLILLGLASFGVWRFTPSAAIHAFAAGAIGGLILAMMTRTSLGHSGRIVTAGRCEIWMYVLVVLAVLCRVAAALAPNVPGVYKWGMTAAGIAWMAAFTTFAIAYAPMLLGRTRKQAHASA
jgi:uncharacterized protein involved in response to NO